MAVLEIQPIQTVSGIKEDAVFFDSVLFRSAWVTANSLFAGAVSVFPSITLGADFYRFVIPQNVNKGKSVRIFFEPQFTPKLTSPIVSPTAQVLSFGNVAGDTIQFDGVPYVMSLTPQNPNIRLQKNSLENIDIGNLATPIRILFNMDVSNSANTGLFTLAAGAAHLADLYLKLSVYFEK